MNTSSYRPKGLTGGNGRAVWGCVGFFFFLGGGVCGVCCVVCWCCVCGLCVCTSVGVCGLWYIVTECVVDVKYLAMRSGQGIFTWKSCGDEVAE